MGGRGGEGGAYDDGRTQDKIWSIKQVIMNAIMDLSHISEDQVSLRTKINVTNFHALQYLM